MMKDRLVKCFSSSFNEELYKTYFEKTKTKVIKLLIKHMSSEILLKMGQQQDDDRKESGDSYKIGNENTRLLAREDHDDKLVDNLETIGSHTKNNFDRFDELKKPPMPVMGYRNRSQLSSFPFDESKLDKQIHNFYVCHEELVKKTRARLKTAWIMIKHIDDYILNVSTRSE